MKPEAAKLMAEKLTTELFQIASGYSQNFSQPREHYVHDFALMLGWDDLERVSLKFYRSINGSKVVKAEYNFSLGQGTREMALDTSDGISIVPIEPPFDMSLVIKQNGKQAYYQDQLWISWANAPQYRRPAGHTRNDGHFARKTGGRAAREVFVADGGTRKTGQVKFYDPVRNYGFIVVDGSGTEVFMHVSQIPHPLVQGQRVSFIPLYTGRGIQAQAVTVLT